MCHMKEQLQLLVLFVVYQPNSPYCIDRLPSSDAVTPLLLSARCNESTSFILPRGAWGPTRVCKEIGCILCDWGRFRVNWGKIGVNSFVEKLRDLYNDLINSHFLIWIAKHHVSLNLDTTQPNESLNWLCVDLTGCPPPSLSRAISCLLLSWDWNNELWGSVTHQWMRFGYVLMFSSWSARIVQLLFHGTRQSNNGLSLWM